MNVPVNTPSMRPWAPAESPPPAEENITLNIDQVFRILIRRFWLITLCTLFAIAVGIAAIVTTTPTYTSGAQILLGEQGRSTGSGADIVSGRRLSDEVIEGELAILRSGRLIARVVEKLGLANDPEFNARLQEQSWLDIKIQQAKRMVKDLLIQEKPTGSGKPSDAVRAAAAAQSAITGDIGAVVWRVSNRLVTRQVGNSFVISVGMTSTDPQKAAAISNAVVDEYILFSMEMSFDAAQRTTDWLDQRLQQMDDEVEEAENAVIAFRTNLLTDSETVERVGQQMSELTTKLVTGRAELAVAEARYRQIAQLIEERGPTAASDVLSTPIVVKYRNELADLRREESDTLTRFGSDSLKLEPIRQSIQTVVSELDREVQRVADELSNDAELARAGVRSLQESLRAMELMLLTHQKDQVELRQLERVASANRLVYEEFLGRFKESREIQSFQIADAEVISYASPPNTPSTPKIFRTLVLACFAGAFVGIGFAFLLELRGSVLVSREEVARATGLQIFGALPLMRSRPEIARATRPQIFSVLPFVRSRRWLRNGPGLIPTRVLDEAGQYARRLRSYIEVGTDEPVRTVLVTSSQPNEGKTMTALLVAWAFAQSGKTCLLLDADMRRSPISRLWPRGSADLRDVLRGHATLDEAAHHDRGTDLDFLAASAPSEDPAALLASKMSDRLLAEALERYDVIVIDSPPLRPVNDALALAEHADLVLFAVRSRATSAKFANESISHLRVARSRKIGAVVTFLRKGLNSDEYSYG